MRKQAIHTAQFDTVPLAQEWLSSLTKERDVSIKEPIHNLQHFQILHVGSSYFVVVLCNHLLTKEEAWNQH